MNPSPVFLTVSPRDRATASANASKKRRRKTSDASSPIRLCRAVDPTKSQNNTVTVADDRAPPEPVTPTSCPTRREDRARLGDQAGAVGVVEGSRNPTSAPPAGESSTNTV